MLIMLILFQIFDQFKNKSMKMYVKVTLIECNFIAVDHQENFHLYTSCLMYFLAFDLAMS